MKKIYTILFSLFLTIAISTNAQIATGNCISNLYSLNNEYFGGFEAGVNNISAKTAGSDLFTRLPRNGSYQIVNDVKQLGGGGYLNIQPQSGNSFFAAHTSTTTTDRIWYTNIAVIPGETYNFCVSVTLLKNLGDGADFIVGLYADGNEIGRGSVTFNWTEICGSFTVPKGVTCIELSVRDPKKGLFFLAMDDIKMYNTRVSLLERNANQFAGIKSNQVKMYPNPAISNLNINIPATKTTSAEIAIIDVSGKIVFVTKTKLMSGNNTFQIPEIAKLSSGVYNVRVNIEGTLTSQKIIIAH